MFKTYHLWQSKLSAVQLVVISLLAFAFNLWATELLNVSYAASGFPVPYWQGQLSFDHVKLKAWYGHLIAKGTLGEYVATQNIDFVFILSVLLLHTSALLSISRFLPAQSKPRLFMVWASLLAIVAPLADVIENGVSYIMLADPAHFEPSLALVYSSFATIKFGMFTFAYIAAICGLLAGVLTWGLQRKKRHNAKLPGY